MTFATLRYWFEQGIWDGWEGRTDGPHLGIKLEHEYLYRAGYRSGRRPGRYLRTMRYGVLTPRIAEEVLQ